MSNANPQDENAQDPAARLSLMARFIPGVIYQFIRRPDNSISFPYVSESIKAVFEWEASQFMENAQLAFDSIHPDDLPRLQQENDRSAETLDTFTFEGRIRTASGNYRWTKISSVPERHANGDILWNGVFVDITDVKEAQEKIALLNSALESRVENLAKMNEELGRLTTKLETAYERALESSNLKSQFVANISHEVRTPISAVIGMADLLLDTPLNQEQRSFAKAVRESAQSLLTIINDILDFSKMEAGKIELENIEFSLLTLIEGCTDLLARSARDKGLAIMCYVDPKIPDTMIGDPIRVRQIILNLLSNAIKFTAHGEIVVRAELDLCPGPDWILIEFSVEDTGIGLSTEEMARLFQPFVQADGSTTRKYGGTGLGLSISKRLVEMMTGQIDVESKQEKGSTFWVKLPFKAVEKKSADNIDSQSKLNGPVLVAIASDTTRDIVTAYLDHLCVANKPADSLASAQNLLSTEKFALVILDFDKSAEELINFITKVSVEKFANIPPTMFLCYADQIEAIQLAERSMFARPIHKPIHRKDIARACRLEFNPQGRIKSPSHPKLSKFLPESTGVRAQIPSLKTKVLVAEDNPVLRELAVKQLEKLGVDAISVANGKQVVEATAANEFELIFMDVQMPTMDGIEATRAIRKREAELNIKHVPIVAMTAGAMAEDREQCMNSGMDDYLAKPVSPEALAMTIKRWTGRNLDYIVKEGLPVKQDQQEKGQGKQQKDQSALSSLPKVDLELLKNAYGEDSIAEVLRSFKDESHTLLKLMHEQIDGRQGRQLSQSAHQLKGLSAVLFAKELDKVVAELMQAAKNNSWEQAQKLIELAEHELTELDDFVNSFLLSEQS